MPSKASRLTVSCDDLDRIGACYAACEWFQRVLNGRPNILMSELLHLVADAVSGIDWIMWAIEDEYNGRTGELFPELVKQWFNANQADCLNTYNKAIHDPSGQIEEAAQAMRTLHAKWYSVLDHQIAGSLPSNSAEEQQAKAAYTQMYHVHSYLITNARNDYITSLRDVVHNMAYRVASGDFD